MHLKAEDVIFYPHVKIEGASYALKFFEQAKLFDYIDDFFEKSGYALFRGREVLIIIHAETCLDKPELIGKATVQESSDIFNDIPHKLGIIDIFEGATINKKEFIRTLFHELDHVLWIFQKGVNLDPSVPYLERVHEQRAFEIENFYAKLLCT